MASTRGTRLFSGLRSVSRRPGHVGRVPEGPSACCALRLTSPASVVHVPTRSMVDFASPDILGIEKLHNSTIDTHKGSMAQEKDTKKASQKLLRTSMSILHGKASSVVSDQSFSAMLRPALDRLTEGDDLYVDEKFSEINLLPSCKAQTHTFNAGDDSAVKAMLKGSKARTKIMIVENGTTTASVRHLKKICRAAKENKVCVVLSDSHGTILMRHITGDQPDLLTILQQPDVICSSLDLISGPRKVSCVTGDAAFIDSLDSSQYERTLETETVTHILERFRLLPRMGAQCYYSLMRSQAFKRTLEELELTVKVLGYKLFIPIPSQKAHTVFTNLWDSGFQVDYATDGQETGIQMAVKASHTNDDIRAVITALCDALDIPLLKSALSRFPKREVPGAVSSWTVPEVVSHIPKIVKAAPTISDKEFSILESVYSWDSYTNHTTTTDITAQSGDHTSMSTDERKCSSLLLDDPSDSGLA